jgi:hypothetical protein
VGRFSTKQGRKLLEKERRLERYARLSDRIKCILLLDAGKSPESVAAYLFLSRNTAVCYADGTHPQHNTHCAHGWIKKGQNKDLDQQWQAEGQYQWSG